MWIQQKLTEADRILWPNDKDEQRQGRALAARLHGLREAADEQGEAAMALLLEAGMIWREAKQKGEASRR